MVAKLGLRFSPRMFLGWPSFGIAKKGLSFSTMRGKVGA